MPKRQTAASEVEIYGLFDPITNELRYIGKANNSANRLKTHLRDARRRRTPVYDWINALSKRGFTPNMQVLLVVSLHSWEMEESRLIFEHRLIGTRLLNLADGGNEPKCSTEIRAANGKKNAQAIHSNPLKRRIWIAKKMLGEALRKGRLKNSVILKMRMCAKMKPEIFGGWANIPLIEEVA